MRNKKIQGQTLFQVSELKQNGTLRSKDGKKSPRKKTSPRGKRKLNFPSKKPGLLFGKRFFLDLSGQGKLKSVQSKIYDLGGNFEEFVSKEVHYIITDRVSVEEVIASNKKGGTQSLAFGPNPSPLQQLSSNKCYGNSPMSTDSPQSLEVRTLNATRGNALLKNVATTQRQGSTNLLEIARKWNVKVMHYDQFINWSKDKISQCKRAEPKEEKRSSKSLQTSTSFKVKSLKSPFIKIEELNRKYRPFYLELDEWPILHFDSAPGHCPFEKPKRKTEMVEPDDELSDKETNKDDSSQDMSEKISESPKEKKDEVKGGYCECCKVRFTSIKQHLKGDQHRAYATNKTNYTELDTIISRGNSFEQFLTEVAKNAESESNDDTQNDLVRPQALGHDGEGRVKHNAVRSEKVALDCFENKKTDASRRGHEFDQLQPDAADPAKKRAVSKVMRPEQFNHKSVPDQMNFESNRQLNDPLSRCKQKETDAGYDKHEPEDEKNICGTFCDQNQTVALSAMNQNEAEHGYNQNEPKVDYNQKKSQIICDLNKDDDNGNQSKPEAAYDQNKSELNQLVPDAICDCIKPESEQSKPENDTARNKVESICNQNQPDDVDSNQIRDDSDNNKPKENRVNSNNGILFDQSQPVAESGQNPPDAVCDQDGPDDLFDQDQNEANDDENKPDVVYSNSKLPAIFDQNKPEMESEAADGKNENNVDCDQNQPEADDAQKQLDASCDHNPTAAICDQNQAKAGCDKNQPVAICDKNQSESDDTQNRLNLTCDNNRPEADKDGALNNPDAHGSQNRHVADYDQNERAALCGEVACHPVSKQKEAYAADDQGQCDSASVSKNIADADCESEANRSRMNICDSMAHDILRGESVTILESTPEETTLKSDVQESSVNIKSEVKHGTLVVEKEVRITKRRKRNALSSSPKSDAYEQDADDVVGGIRSRRYSEGQHDGKSLFENEKISSFNRCTGRPVNGRLNLMRKRRKTDSDIENNITDNDVACDIMEEYFTEKSKNRKSRCNSDDLSTIWFQEEIDESAAFDARRRFGRRLGSTRQGCDEIQSANMRRKLRSKGQRALEPSITFVDYGLTERVDDKIVSKTGQPPDRFNRSSLPTNSKENSSYYSPLKELRNDKISHRSCETGSDNRYLTRFLDKDKLDLQDEMELDRDVTAGTSSGSSTQSDEAKPNDDRVVKDPKFSGSSTIDLQYPDEMTNVLHAKLTMRVPEERTSGTDDSQFAAYNFRRNEKVTAPIDILISQPKRSPDLPPRRNADKPGPLQFTPDIGFEFSSPESTLKCRNEIEDILCTLKSPKESVSSSENSANVKCKKTLAIPIEAGFEEAENKENEISNLNMDHTPKKRKYSREGILRSSPRRSEQTCAMEDPEGLSKHNPRALPGSEYLPDCDELKNVASHLQIPDTKQPNSGSCSSAFGDTNDVFYDDHRIEISLHERVKTRKRQASLLAGAMCSEHLTTPTKKRSILSKKGSILRISKARSESGVSETSNDVDTERFRLVSVDENERLRHYVAVDPSVLASTPALPRIKSREECSESGVNGPNTDVDTEQFHVVSANEDQSLARGVASVVASVPSVLASTPALPRTKTTTMSSLEKPEESNSVIRRTSPRKTKQTVAISHEKHKESSVISNDTSVNTQSANSSLLADSSSSLNTSNPVALSISSALLSSKRAKSKKKSSKDKKSKSTVSSKNRLTLGAKKSSTKTTSSKRKAKKNFEFSDEDFDF